MVEFCSCDIWPDLMLCMPVKDSSLLIDHKESPVKVKLIVSNSFSSKPICACPTGINTFTLLFVTIK